MKSRIFDFLAEERMRQETTINLIASENYAKNDILKVCGSILTNKYAEGYPGKRYYGGCEIVDKIENYVIDLGKKLFECDHLNVQPHAGSQANMAVYFSQLDTGDTILGMSLKSGGHLTHGHKVNFSGKLFNVVTYSVSPETEQIDYDAIEILTAEHKPKMIIAGASAYSRIIDFGRLATIAEDYHAKLFVDMAHIAGLVAAGLHPSPIPLADFVSSTTHKTLRGPRGGMICCRAEYAESIDKGLMPGIQGGPLMHIIAAKAIAFEEALKPEFKDYQQQVISNANAMAQTFKDLGYHVISGGTDTHLFLIDLRKHTHKTLNLTGNGAEKILEQCGIIVNKNMIPFDTATPQNPSGIRIGTPAITTRGFTKQEAIEIVHWIDEALTKKNDVKFLISLKEKVVARCKQFPIYD